MTPAEVVQKIIDALSAAEAAMESSDAASAQAWASIAIGYGPLFNREGQRGLLQHDRAARAAAQGPPS